MTRLLHSAKFWMFIVSQVIVLAMFFVSKYAPGAVEDVRMVLAFVDGLAALVIGAYCLEDLVEKSRGGPSENSR